MDDRAAADGLADAVAPLILGYLDAPTLAAARVVNRSWRASVELEGPLHSPFLRRIGLLQKKLPSMRGELQLLQALEVSLCDPALGDLLLLLGHLGPVGDAS